MRTLIAFAVALCSLVGFSGLEAARKDAPKIAPKYKIDAEALLNFKEKDSAFVLEVVDQPLEAMRSIGHYAYSYKAKGAPVDTSFLLVNMPLSGIVGDVHKVVFNEDGQIQLAELGEKQPFITTPVDTAPGQEFVVFVADMQGQPLSRVAFTPYPFVVTNDTGYKLTFKLINPILSIYTLKAEGFAPGEKVRQTARSGDEVITKEIELDATGVATIILKPAVDGKMAGWSDVTLSGEKGKIAIRYPWGLNFGPWAKKMVTRAEQGMLGTAPKSKSK